jgi:hypothetical protein
MRQTNCVNKTIIGQEIQKMRGGGGGIRLTAGKKFLNTKPCTVVMKILGDSVIVAAFDNPV